MASRWTERRWALDSTDTELPQVIDPRTNGAYVLIPLMEYKNVCEILEDKGDKGAIRTVGLRTVDWRVDEAPLIEPGLGKA